ncbi:MAG: hypothetical protein SGCHY_005593 [Lobulomycetales sp.]
MYEAANAELPLQVQDLGPKTVFEQAYHILKNLSLQEMWEHWTRKLQTLLKHQEDFPNLPRVIRNKREFYERDCVPPAAEPERIKSSNLRVPVEMKVLENSSEAAPADMVVLDLSSLDVENIE